MRAVLKALLFFGLLLAAGLSAGGAMAESRIALVIGNSKYINVRALANPANDASAVADLFRAAGFDVVDASHDLGGIEMRRAFRDFAEKSRSADVAVVYYAGHGIEIDGTNYLLPVDTSLERDLDVEDEAISLDRLVRTLEPAKRLRLIILDACRDNPFVRTMRRTSETRSVGRGLAKIEPPSADTLIAFAAKAGSTAADGDGLHSPFTTALLKNLTTPGLDLRIALGRVRDDVMAMTGKRQEPFVYGSLGGTTVSLVPEVKQDVAARQPAPPAAQTDPNADIRRDFGWALEVNSKEAWDAFLKLHVTGFYADLARGHRAKLAAAGDKVAVQTPPPAPSVPAPNAAPPAPPAAVISSVAPTETPKPAIDPFATTRMLNAELKRLGCYAGDADASWDSGSRRALERFNKLTGQNLDTQVASVDALGVLRAKTTRVCPLECKPGYRAENEACVKVACGAGFVMGAKGECERRPKGKAAALPDSGEPKRSAAPKARAGGRATEQIVCGTTGCKTVGAGCRAEQRAVGNGGDYAAVVICDK